MSVRSLACTKLPSPKTPTMTRTRSSSQTFSNTSSAVSWLVDEHARGVVVRRFEHAALLLQVIDAAL